MRVRVHTLMRFINDNEVIINMLYQIDKDILAKDTSSVIFQLLNRTIMMSTKSFNFLTTGKILIQASLPEIRSLLKSNCPSNNKVVITTIEIISTTNKPSKQM